MEDLPLELSFKIFSRFNRKTVLLCRCVCRSWRDFIDSEYFAENYVCKPKLLFIDRNFQGNKTKVFSLKQDPDHDYNSTRQLPLIKSPLATITHSSSYVSNPSCYGWFLFRDIEDKVPPFVFNPLRSGGELLQLPRPKTESGYGFYGIGYDSRTKTYKVVHVYCTRKKGVKAARVFELGTKSWREISAVPPPLHIRRESISVRGDVHWGKSFDTRLNRCAIITFDIKEETFTLIQYPKFIERDVRDNQFNLFDFKGYLGVVYAPNYTGIEVWKMKEYKKKEWTREYRIGCEGIGPCFPTFVGAWKEGFIFSETKFMEYLNAETDELTTVVLPPRHESYVESLCYVSCSLVSLRKYGGSVSRKRGGLNVFELLPARCQGNSIPRRN